MFKLMGKKKNNNFCLTGPLEFEYAYIITSLFLCHNGLDDFTDKVIAMITSANRSVLVLQSAFFNNKQLILLSMKHSKRHKACVCFSDSANFVRGQLIIMMADVGLRYSESTVAQLVRSLARMHKLNIANMLYARFSIRPSQSKL